MLTLVTGNPKKALEFSGLMSDVELTTTSVDIDEVQSLDLAYVARRKAEAAYRALGRPVIVDDTGFYLRALGDLP